jgi:hypothetical protein
MLHIYHIYIYGIKDMVLKNKRLKNTFKLKKKIKTSSPRGYKIICHKKIELINAHVSN